MDMNTWLPVVLGAASLIIGIFGLQFFKWILAKGKVARVILHATDTILDALIGNPEFVKEKLGVEAYKLIAELNEALDGALEPNDPGELLETINKRLDTAIDEIVETHSHSAAPLKPAREIVKDSLEIGVRDMLIETATSDVTARATKKYLKKLAKYLDKKF